MEKTILHNMDTWFAETNITPKQYFETKFAGNKIGSIKLPATLAKQNTTEEQINKIVIAIGNGYINLAVKLKGKKLRKIPFAMMEKKDREAWRYYVMEEVQHALINNLIHQIVNASSISTPNFTITQDTSSWVFTTDQLSTRGNVNIQNTEIDFYDILESRVAYMEAQNGNIKILRKIEDWESVPAMVFDEI